MLPVHQRSPKQIAPSTSFLPSCSPASSTSSRTIRNSARYPSFFATDDHTAYTAVSAQPLLPPSLLQTIPKALSPGRLAPASAVLGAGSPSSQLRSSQTPSEEPAGQLRRTHAAAVGPA
ncbi:uncharacterized protein MONOS_11248 [Monocercomonoides exilis]|uniref:uncharacterized protein n=1 Tax=Monocercomonoides exilis TaxID=2049356 RepID=UPI0035593E24|nr:hypothetical protein MONOS_11248 [Monocercomonoides exilis]|eukprot:MONOS_11248.1-p1 / transcript=MONOS_11248.1 / gene=MONOS_11248 / organism=Monocercomonoides_exilis_PA203 / gene_product=unspecified product / transcript_product=unspecified product / location=Mono_scaffold00554:7060-7416(-) / protein_length=119 / sequence_SO=supercontig / SO=protein_coding / is_pseudo=false